MSLLSERLSEILEVVPASELDYTEWCQVGMALKAEGFDVSVWDEWSAKDAGRYHAGECERKWRSFSDGRIGDVSGGTIIKMAQDRGWRTYSSDAVSEAYGWDDEIDASWDYHTSYQEQKQRKPSTQIIDPTWVEADEVTEPTDWHGHEDLIAYLEALFDPDDHVGYVTEAFERDPGSWSPSGTGHSARTAGELIAAISKYGDDLSSSLGKPNEQSGAWIRFNPLDGHGVKNENVSEFRYALVESDKTSIGHQIAIVKQLDLPIAALVHSGNKSVHAIVHIDAKSYDEYRERVDFLYRVCRDNGLDVDTQNKNPSRLSRMPGVMRNCKKQWLIATHIGKSSWAEWKDWLEEQNDNLPDPESLSDVWDSMPELSPPLIEGVLRQGHKLLIAGPSKAGKSFSLIGLTISIAEGKKWFGWQCAKGKVLYVNLELDRASCLRRFADVYKARNLAPESLSNVLIWNLRGKSRPMDELAPALIRRALKDRPIAVIIDPIYKVITGDENSADQMAAFCNQFDKVADALGCAVIYCHHHSKGMQGAKRSMDRASGSGVFARDPDAILDMIELHVSDSMRLQQVSEALVDTCTEILNKDAQTSSKWRERIPLDEQVVGEKLLASARSLVSDERALLSAVYEARQRTHNKSAWRIEGTLREFPRFDPVNIWFEYPVHKVDTSGILQDASPEGEVISQQDYRQKGREKKAERDEARQREKLQALREGMEQCKIDGVEPTIANVVDRMPEVAGRQVSKGTVQNWVKEGKNDWCTIRNEQSERGKVGILVDPELEELIEGF